MLIFGMGYAFNLLCLRHVDVTLKVQIIRAGRESMAQRVRIADIAEELGVSSATVSNVIHGKTKKISDATVKRVQELLEERQYIPSMAGILLSQNDSRIVGVVINDHIKYEGKVLEDAFVASALNALMFELERNDYFMMVKATADWNEIVRLASMWNMDGMVLIGFCDADYEKLREKMHIPFVVYDGYFENNERICNLTIDNFDGGRQVGDYLYRMGHRRVLCISDNYVCVDKERIDGCGAGLMEGTIDFLQVPMQKEERQRFYKANIQMILRHTAAFAVSDVYAVELMHFLQEQGIGVPEDISVIGFDNIRLCENSYPRLTTVGQDASKRAYAAVQALQNLKKGTCEMAAQILPVRLVVRDSVKRIGSTAGDKVT